MTNRIKAGVPQALAITLGLLATLTVIFQVVTAGSTVTPRETALFSVLQFVFSIAFAWILTRIAARNEFIDSQKQFAVAAYRRINEIDEGVERLLTRARNQLKRAKPETRRELEVVLALGVGIRASIKSSIADWGDVIGEEISTINRIERIKTAQELLLEDPDQDDLEGVTADISPAPVTAQLLKGNEEIAKLLRTLPYSLQIVAEDKSPARDLVDQHVDRLRREYRRTGAVRLAGFYEPSLQRDIRSFSVGDRLRVSVGSVGERRLAVCARDLDGKTVGIITNNGAPKYYIFREALILFLGESEFEIIITEINPANDGERHYFRANIVLDKLPPLVRVG